MVEFVYVVLPPKKQCFETSKIQFAFVSVCVLNPICRGQRVRRLVGVIRPGLWYYPKPNVVYLFMETLVPIRRKCLKTYDVGLLSNCYWLSQKPF